MTAQDIDLKWGKIVDFMSERFAQGEEELDLQAILFFVGIQELGQGFKEFSKDEKMDLLHIAICKLLSRFDYYSFDKTDEEGWPHYKLNKTMPPLSPKKQNELMKESLVYYFEEQGVKF